LIRKASQVESGADVLERRDVEYLARDVVIVGAGAIGLAVALQLRRAGIASVLVVDRYSAPGQGSTSRTNGGVRAQFGTPTNIAFSQFTIDALVALDRVTGGLVGLRQVGYLFMTGDESNETKFRQNFNLQHPMGVPVQLLTPSEVVDLVPFVRAEGLCRGTFCPTDGVIDPHGVVLALWQEGKRLGAEYRLSEEVNGIEPVKEGLTVKTSNLSIKAEIVVNAAGPYASALAAVVGVTLPVQPYRRNLACTEPTPKLPDLIPMCVDMDTGVLIRREARGVLLAYSDPLDEPTFESAFDQSFLEALAERVDNRFSFLKAIPIDDRKCWAGLYPETPDHQAIISPAMEQEPLINCVGFGGHGIMHSLAAGHAVMELIRDGRCSTFDLRPFRPARFEDGDYTVETAVL
jgi:sarcosine oxidase, subunit beta